MCGITGFYNQQKPLEQAKQTINKMLNAIVHRGPDDYGIWQQKALTLGHRRLSIHDLTSAGHQPMQSMDKRFTIVFNGEIYNFEELRAELGVIQWRGHSDTEVMLAAISKWGFNKALEKFNGMFAFALWDAKEETLTLARDRFGEKPLYYYHHKGVFAFASEIKALEADESLYLIIDRIALKKQLEVGYIPGPLSIYTHVKKLPPGGILTFSTNREIAQTKYWRLADHIKTAKQNLFSCEHEAVEVLNSTLKKAVKLRMAADVPLGGFLSGGVDSSLILALMQNQSDKPVNSFSIGFDVPGYNEAVHAKRVANYLGTNHSEQYLTPKDALDIIPELGSMFDEPFSDSSQIPTYLVSAMAKKHVTVCLSGDGGTTEERTNLDVINILLEIIKTSGQINQRTKTNVIAQLIAVLLGFQIYGRMKHVIRRRIDITQSPAFKASGTSNIGQRSLTNVASIGDRTAGPLVVVKAFFINGKVKAVAIVNTMVLRRRAVTVITTVLDFNRGFGIAVAAMQDGQTTAHDRHIRFTEIVVTVGFIVVIAAIGIVVNR